MSKHFAVIFSETLNLLESTLVVLDEFRDRLLGFKHGSCCKLYVRIVYPSENIHPTNNKKSLTFDTNFKTGRLRLEF